MQLTESKIRAVVARQAGASQEEAGRMIGVTAQRVYQIEKENRRHMEWLQLELLKAKATGDAIGLAVPHQSQEGRRLAIDYFYWVAKELRRNGMPVQVIHKATTAGSVFFIEPIDTEDNEKKETT